MSIKRILVPMPDTTDAAGEIDMALAAATLLEAHVEALYLAEPPPPTPAGVQISEGMRYGGPTGDGLIVSPAADERERHTKARKESFVRACGSNQIPVLEQGAEVGMLPSASWREMEGSYATLTVRRAVAFDLIVASSAAVANSLKDIAEATLLRTGRPVLLAPLRHEVGLNGPAIVAWDDSPQCWHAVTAAVPFLHHAASIEVLSVAKDEDERRSSQQEVVAYLRCHGLSAMTTVISSAGSVATTLLAEASDRGAGLMVMGAYSHSPLREMLLGGVTRHILQNAAATPVLMAH